MGRNAQKCPEAFMRSMPVYRQRPDGFFQGSNVALSGGKWNCMRNG
jgi:hypothetical protein